MELKEEDEAHYEARDVCPTCGCAIREDLGMIKVRDHIHLTGRYRTLAHQSCNLNYQLSDFVPIFLKNLSGTTPTSWYNRRGSTKRTKTLPPKGREVYLL